MTRVNLLSNPSFRDGLVGYTALSGATLSIQTGEAFYGSTLLRVSKDAQSDSGVQTDPVAVTEGVDYAYSAYVRVPRTVPPTEAAHLTLRITWFGPSNVRLSDSTTALSSAVPSVIWTRLTGVSVAPPGAVAARLSVSQPDAGTAEQPFFLDALLFEASSFVGGYLDNVSKSAETAIVNTALTPLPAPTINGMALEADISLGDLVFNTIDEDNITWVCTDLKGWWGNVEPEAPSISRGVEDGEYDVTGRSRARMITLSGVFLLPDPSLLGTARDKLVSAVNLVRKGAWLRTNESPTRAAYVKLNGKPDIETVNARGRTEFVVNLKAADPIRYAWDDNDLSGVSTSTISTPSSALATNLATNPSFETGAGPIEIQRNLAINPNSGTTTGWNTPLLGTGATASSVMISAAGENAAFGYVTTWTTTGMGGAASLGYGRGTSATDLAVVGGTTISGSMWVKFSLAVSPVSASLVFYNASGTMITAINGAPTSFTGGIGKRIRVEGVVVPALATRASLYLKIDSLPASLPGLELVQSTPMISPSHFAWAYFDGNTPDTEDFTYDFAGLPGAAISVQSGVVPAGSVSPVSVGGARFISSGWAKTGTKSVSFLSNRADTNESMFFAAGGLSDLGGMTPGKTYTIGISLHLAAPLAAAGANSLKIRLRWAMGALVGQAISAPAPNTAGTHELRVTATIPSTGVTGIMVQCDQWAPGQTWWDNLTIIEVPSVTQPYTGPYFDGNTISTDYFNYSWRGVVDGSTSLRSPTRSAVGTISNVGTANVTAVFNLHGPLGARSTIYNSLSGETATTVDQLRGIGNIATIATKSLTNNIATLTTTTPHGLVVGDTVLVSGVGAPFDAVNGAHVLTAVSNFFPYSFSYTRVSADVEQIASDGQVSLSKNDVLSIDTYNRSVSFNGSDVGQRGKIETLVDWIKLAPGDNVVSFSDTPTVQTITTKSLTDNIVTLTTTQPHYFVPGEFVVVDFQTVAELAKKSLTGNVATLTTAEPHGMSVGDRIDVATIQISNVINKALVSNVATLTTDVLGSFAIGDDVAVALKSTASVASKSVTSNVLTITTEGAHNFSVADEIKLELATNATVVGKSVSSNMATLTTSTAHNFSIGDRITVALATDATIIRKAVSGGYATITTSAAHGFTAGDVVAVDMPTTAALSNVRSISGALATLNTVAAHKYSVGDRIVVNTGVLATAAISGASAATDICTLTIGSNGFSVGETLIVRGVNARYNGTFRIVSMTGTTVSYTNPGAATAFSSTGGTVENSTLLSGYGGASIIEAIPSATSFSILDYVDGTTSSTAVGTGGTVVNATNSSINGVVAILSTTTTSFTYAH